MCVRPQDRLLGALLAKRPVKDPSNHILKVSMKHQIVCDECKDNSKQKWLPLTTHKAPHNPAGSIQPPLLPNLCDRGVLLFVVGVNKMSPNMQYISTVIDGGGGRDGCSIAVGGDSNHNDTTEQSQIRTKYYILPWSVIATSRNISVNCGLECKWMVGFLAP